MTYFLSDAHLGSRALSDAQAHQAGLVELLYQMRQDAREIYILGDLFDYWFEYLWPDKSKRQYSPVLEAIRQLTDSGIAVHFFIGNHDIWTFGQLAKLTGMTIHRHPETIMLHGKRCLMAHGDGLVPSDYLKRLPKPVQRKIRKFKWLRALFHHPIAQALYRCVPPCVGNAIGYRWAKKSRLRDLNHPCGYKGEDREELVLYAKEQEQRGEHYDYYIFGHRHIELDLMTVTQSRVVILGDCFRQWTYAQMDDNGNLQLCIHEKNN